MSYDAVIDQVKSLPESSLEDVSRYIEFLLYQQEQDRMAPLIESDEVLAGSQFIDDDNGNEDYPTGGEGNDAPAKFDVWG